MTLKILQKRENSKIKFKKASILMGILNLTPNSFFLMEENI